MAVIAMPMSVPMAAQDPADVFGRLVEDMDRLAYNLLHRHG
jgi:hypothetical protein